MKIVELTKNLVISVTNEEADLLTKLGDKTVLKSELTEREQVLANQLTVKDLLLRTNEDGKIYYKKFNRD